MNIYIYTASANPLGAKSVIEQYGMQAIQNPEMLAKQLAHTVQLDGQNALDKIANIHPDLALFQDNIDKFKKEIQEQNKAQFTNASGCGCHSNFSSANGQEIKSHIEGIRTDAASGNNSKVELALIMGGIIALALILNKP